MKRIGIIFVLSAALGVSLAPAVAIARSLTNPIWDGRYPVSCNVGGSPCTFCDLLKVGANIIDTLTLLVIPIGAAVIVYGGFRIMTAGSSPTGLSTGKEAMKMAGIGIAISLSGWLIVNTVFSLLSGGGSLTAIQCPAGDIFTRVPYIPVGADCSRIKLSMSGDTPLGTVWTVQDATARGYSPTTWCKPEKVGSNLITIQSEISWLQETTSRSITPNSAFRPKSYQKHLREVWDAKQLLTEIPTLTANCAADAAIVNSEFSRHGLNSRVSDEGSSPHERGYGVDLSIGGCGNANFTGQCSELYDRIDTILKSTQDNHIPKLKWNKIRGDEVHFDLLPTQRQENRGC
ncbi:MAG: pilin [bacterium]|nr:pilin [bacterium]